MNNDSKYALIDIELVDNSPLLMNRVLNTIKTFNLDNVRLVTDNNPDYFTLDENNEKIISLEEDAPIYLANPVVREDGTKEFEIYNIIKNEIIYKDTVIRKYDIISFTLDEVKCKGIALDFSECETAVYIETLVNNEDGLSIIYLYLNKDCDIEVIEPLDQEIIDKMVEKID